MLKKIGIIVVTYNRSKCLAKCLDCLQVIDIPMGYEVDVIVLDNCSNDDTERILEGRKKYIKNLQVIRTKENLGGAGGFSAGIQYAKKNGVDYLWGMDDDAYVNKNSLIEIINAYEKKNEICCMWSNCDEDESFESNIKKVNSWMFVGFFLPINIVDEVGLPREDFFIYHDDEEYAARIIKKGYAIYKVKNSIINHKDAAHKQPKLLKKFLGYTIEQNQLPNWKLYYYLRNAILMYSYKDWKKYKIVFVSMPRYLIKTIYLQPNQCKIVLLAIFHGIIGKKGKIINP